MVFAGAAPVTGGGAAAATVIDDLSEMKNGRT